MGPCEKFSESQNLNFLIGSGLSTALEAPSDCSEKLGDHMS